MGRDLSQGVRLYAVVVAALRPDGNVRTWTATARAADVSSFERGRRVFNEIIEAAERDMPVARGFRGHTVTAWLDITEEARDFVATYG